MHVPGQGISGGYCLWVISLFNTSWSPVILWWQGHSLRLDTLMPSSLETMGRDRSFFIYHRCVSTSIVFDLVSEMQHSSQDSAWPRWSPVGSGICKSPENQFHHQHHQWRGCCLGWGAGSCPGGQVLGGWTLNLRPQNTAALNVTEYKLNNTFCNASTCIDFYKRK